MQSRRHDGFTLFESLIALALFVMLGFFIWELFGALFPRDGPMSLNIAASRSLVLQQSRQAIRKLFYRVQEGIQLISPAPGRTARELVFRDIRNRSIRLRHVATEKRVVCEYLQEDGTWVPEKTVESTNARPIQIDSCESALFTALTPATVCVNFTTSDDRVRETYMTVITLSNTRLDR